MMRAAIIGFLLVLTCALVQADTLVLRDGRQYTGDVVKNARGYTVFIGKKTFNFSDDQVSQWVKGDAKPVKNLDPKIPAGPVAAHQRKGDPKTLAALEIHGRDALSAGAYRVARNAYSDWLLIDPAEPEALEGAGLSYLGMGDLPRGKQFLEVSLTNSHGAIRSIALNTAVANVRTKQHFRAAKILHELLSQSTTEDTRALDLLQFSLNQCDAIVRKNRNFDEVKAFAAQYEAKLDAEHPGQKRWGGDWLSSSEVEARKKVQKSDENSVKQVEAELAGQKRDLGVADTELARQTVNLQKGLSSQFVVDKQRKEVDRLREIVNATELKLTGIRDTANSASAFAIALEPMLPGEPPAAVVAVATETKPPVQVAIATPTPTPPTPSPSPTPTPTPTPPPTPEPPAAPPLEPTPAPIRHREIVDYAAGFAVAPNLIVTDALSIEGATSIRVQMGGGAPVDATLVRKNDETGLALLRIEGPGMHYVVLDKSFAGGPIKCVSYPEVDLFDPRASIIDGSLQASGPGWAVTLTHHPRLAGGPLTDLQGRVVGIELASRDSGMSKIHAASTKDIFALLGADAPRTYGTARATDATLQITATH